MTNDYLLDILLGLFRQRFYCDMNFPNGTIGDLGNVVAGATPSKKLRDNFTANGIGWITPRDLAKTSSIFISHGATDITDKGYCSCSATLMPKGSVLFSSRAPVGYVAIAAESLCTNQGFKSVVPHDNIGTAYVFCFLKENAAAIENTGSGTTFIEVSGRIMKDYPAYIPEEHACKSFSQLAGPILELIRINEKARCNLEMLRDALLPRLMSGDIDVSRINCSIQ
ncbi:MAG: restriction endonuclease subunit S [Atopobiaceae bacterium]|jgi:type I restriction enzyme S subunit|nr:restriction endonuclease subunit S [Atopobiaceae bacterium]